MRVFVTGASGFIGSRVVRELNAAGHQVTGLVRSDEGAKRVAALGADVQLGTLEDPDGLAQAAGKADAVIHLAFDHDFSRFLDNTEKDRRVIAAIGDALAGSGRPFIITSGVGMGSAKPGALGTEDVLDLGNPNPRIASEKEAAVQLGRGSSIATVRLPQVHDTERQGLLTYLFPVVREKGFAGYVGSGENRWSAAHVDDVARLYRLALERHEAGARWHAVAEEAVPMRRVAETIAQGFGVPARSLTPDEAAEYFGWLAMFASMDLPASSAWTRQTLGWEPTGPGLIADLEGADYAVGVG